MGLFKKKNKEGITKVIFIEQKSTIFYRSFSNKYAPETSRKSINKNYYTKLIHEYLDEIVSINIRTDQILVRLDNDIIRMNLIDDRVNQCIIDIQCYEPGIRNKDFHTINGKVYTKFSSMMKDDILIIIVVDYDGNEIEETHEKVYHAAVDEVFDYMNESDQFVSTQTGHGLSREILYCKKGIEIDSDGRVCKDTNDTDNLSDEPMTVCVISDKNLPDEIVPSKYASKIESVKKLTKLTLKYLVDNHGEEFVSTIVSNTIHTLSKALQERLESKLEVRKDK